ncbi:uncharacterized protein A4U43_UnF3370 [Asparagus officinalis]|uniref:Uncharacterized protein n=1 Tax=Asparagus officinalis TaxID=4686 RepID=A0A1R3L734_ASPOF|nr:uncharacterized protein A4U43_UnF3370 [Asparagus officinalis]
MKDGLSKKNKAKSSLSITVRERSGGGIPKAKAKNAAAAQDDKNRRPLGDIGNVVGARPAIVEGKPLHQISRPITRSFRAQLLANAQADAVQNKKPVVLAVDGDIRKAHIKEVKQKAVAIKPKPEIVIEISPDTHENLKERPDASRKNGRKKINTMSSVLSARSKAACGVSEKLKDSIPDIDASDIGDQLAVVDYVEDLYKFYKLSEQSSRPHDYIDSQTEINEKMRAILGDWLIEVHHKFELMPETLYLTFYIIDRYLSMEKVLRRELQLVGVSSMLIASKYEEIWAPQVEDFICISDRAYSQEQILAMEKSILNRLEWSLTVPTPYVFLVRFIKAAMCDKEMEHMVYFFAELGLIQYSMIMYSPSTVAASAVYAARCTLKKSPLWTESLKHYTGFSEPQLL